MKFLKGGESVILTAGVGAKWREIRGIREIGDWSNAEAHDKKTVYGKRDKGK